MYKININKKTIIIIAIILIIIAAYFIYENNFKKSNIIVENQIEEISTNQTKEEKKEIIIHIVGAVKTEGVLTIDEDKRINDAIEMAGGLLENADVSTINLASKLEDGMKIYIPTKEEVEQIKNENSLSQEEISYEESYNTDINQNKKNEKININKASQKELETLPGIGESTALKIINYRNEHGKFESIENIKDVSGIGDAKFDNIKDLISV